jgi:hypothetical protein
MLRRLVPLLTVFVLPVMLFAADDYKLGPDSMEQPDVPKGEVQKFTWKSKIFDGTERDYWVYVPKQYNPKEPACVMVFQDGGAYVNPKGSYRVPVVFDNLIHKKELPVIIGIFVNPGVIPAAQPGGKERKHRSFEYDTLSDQYVRFLEKEILPEVGKKYNLRQDAAGRGVGAARPVQQGAEPHRQLHQHPRRRCLSGDHPQDGEEADPGVPAGRGERLGQPARQLAAGQQADGRGPEVHGLRLPARDGRRRPHRQARRLDPAGIAEVAVAAGEVRPADAKRRPAGALEKERVAPFSRGSDATGGVGLSRP